jgi:hypothetical protein
MRIVGHVSWGNPKKRHNLEDLGVDGFGSKRRNNSFLRSILF